MVSVPGRRSSRQFRGAIRWPCECGEFQEMKGAPACHLIREDNNGPNIMQEPDAKKATSNLMSHFKVLRLVCQAFEVDMPEMELMLQLVRTREDDPDKHFPKKLNRVMLGAAERDQSKWSKGLATIAERALYARILGRDDKPTFSRTGHITEQVVFHCLDLYRQIAPRLETKGIPPEVVLWVLIEQVFIPTLFAHLMLKWERGLGHEFLPLDPWYFPMFEREYKSPIMRVLRSWMRAAGYRTAQDFGKALDDDDMRRKVDGWLSGQHVPTIIEAHALVDMFADEVRWLDSANDWKDRVTLAVAMTNLCKRMDAYFRSLVSQPSLELRKLLGAANDDKVPIDEGRQLADPRNFFAVRLLKHRLIREDQWDAEVLGRVRSAVGSRPPTSATMEQWERFRSDLYWRLESGNWLLAYIQRQNTAINWQDTLVGLAVDELNVKLRTKRAGEPKPTDPEC